MGLRHFGQVGGGAFLGMTRTLDPARVPNSLHRLMPRMDRRSEILTKGFWRVCPACDLV
jgi:hypothetical protein